MRRPRWLPQFTIGTASQAVAALIVLGVVTAVKGSRHAIADAVRWLTHPVDTPRVIFVLLLALASTAGVMLLAALGRRLFGVRIRHASAPNPSDLHGSYSRIIYVLT
jgi:hypothetical protein